MIIMLWISNSSTDLSRRSFLLLKRKTKNFTIPVSKHQFKDSTNITTMQINAILFLAIQVYTSPLSFSLTRKTCLKWDLKTSSYNSWLCLCLTKKEMQLVKTSVDWHSHKLMTTSLALASWLYKDILSSSTQLIRKFVLLQALIRQKLKYRNQIRNFSLNFLQLICLS